MAIAFGSGNNSGAQSNFTSITTAFTVSAGSNLFLYVGFGSRDTTGGDSVISSGTFNGDALTEGITELLSTDTTFRSTSLYRINPDVATGNVVLNFAGTVAAGAMVFAYVTGAHQTTQPDGVDSNSNAASTTLSIAHPITTSNSWVFAVAYSRSGAVTVDTGTELANIAVNGADDIVAASYEGPIASTGDHTVQMTETDTGNDWAMTTLSVTPAADSTVVKDLIMAGMIPFAR